MKPPGTPTFDKSLSQAPGAIVCSRGVQLIAQMDLSGVSTLGRMSLLYDRYWV